MDTQSPQPQVVQCQCRHCRRRGWGIIGGFFRFIGLVILLVIVFVTGLSLGGVGSFPKVVARLGDDSDGPRMMYKGGLASLSPSDAFFASGDRRFGVVIAVQDQTVSIADNGGGTTTVVANADTVVMDGEREIPVWTLRRGNSVRVYGSLDEGILTARLIELLR